MLLAGRPPIVETPPAPAESVPRTVVAAACSVMGVVPGISEQEMRKIVEIITSLDGEKTVDTVTSLDDVRPAVPF